METVRIGYARDWWVSGNRCKTDTQYVVKLPPAALSILECCWSDGAECVFAFMPYLNTVDRSLKRITTTQTYAKVIQPMIDREVEMLKEKLAGWFAG